MMTIEFSLHGVSEHKDYLFYSNKNYNTQLNFAKDADILRTDSMKNPSKK